jgi:hypothetical protein
MNADLGQGVYSITFRTLCTTACPGGTPMSLYITNLLNRQSVRVIPNNFQIRTYTVEGYKIDLATVTTATGLLLKPAPFGEIALSAPLSPILTGAKDTYTLTFTSVNGIAANSQGMAQVIFPSEIVLAGDASSSCSASVSSTSMSCVIDFAHQ